MLSDYLNLLPRSHLGIKVNIYSFMSQKYHSLYQGYSPLGVSKAESHVWERMQELKILKLKK